MMRLVVLIAAAVLVLPAAACGKKGDLLPPPGYDKSAPRDTETGQEG